MPQNYVSSGDSIRKILRYSIFILLYNQPLPTKEKRTTSKGWLAIAKLKPLSLFIFLLIMLKKALDNGKMVK